MASIRDWSQTAADNDDADSGINWTEGQSPKTVNNSARQVMGRVAEWRDDLGGELASTGSSNAYAVTANSAFTAYETGIVLVFKANHSNTGAATLNVNAIGAKAIRKFTTAEAALVSGDIIDDGIYVVRYDATANSAAGAWILENPTVTAGTALYTPTWTASSPYVISERLGDVPHSRDFGLIDDDTNDQATELQAFLTGSVGHRAIIEKGVFLTDSTITIDSPRLSIVGAGGHLEGTEIRGTDSSVGAGPVLRIKDRSIHLSGLTITATDLRRSSGATGGHGILIADDDLATPASKSRILFRDILISKQPATGLVAVGSMQWSRFEQITVSECLEHGAVFDDGTYIGYTNLHEIGLFEIDLLSVRHCAGTALALGYTGQTSGVYRADVKHLELVNNAWDSSTRLSDHQMYCGIVQTMTMNNCGFGDDGYLETTTDSGYARTGKAAPSGGINYVNVDNLTEISNRYIGLTKSADIGASCSTALIFNPRIQVGPVNWSTPQPFGFVIANGASSVEVWAGFQSGADELLKTNDDGTRYVSAEKQFRAIAGWDDGDWELGAVGANKAVASGDLLVQADLHNISGEGGVADDLVNIYIPDTASTTIMAPSGFRLTLFNNNSYIITITGAGNVKTPFDVPWLIYPNTAIHFVSNGTNWLIEGVDQVAEFPLVAGAVAAAHTGTLVETNLATGTLRASAMSTDGSLLLTLAGSATNNANAKTIRLRLQGVAVVGVNVANGAAWEIEAKISNLGSEASQAIVTTTVIDATVSVARATATVNTALDRTIAISAQLGDITDSVTLDRYSLKLAR